MPLSGLWLAIGLPLAVANVKLVPAAYRAQQAEAQTQQVLGRPIPPPVELPKAAEEPPELAPGERRKT